MEIKAEFNKLNFGKKETSVTENNFPKEQVSCTKLWMFREKKIASLKKDRK